MPCAWSNKAGGNCASESFFAQVFAFQAPYRLRYLVVVVWPLCNLKGVPADNTQGLKKKYFQTVFLGGVKKQTNKQTNPPKTLNLFSFTMNSLNFRMQKVKISILYQVSGIYRGNKKEG